MSVTFFPGATCTRRLIWLCVVQRILAISYLVFFNIHPREFDIGRQANTPLEFLTRVFVRFLFVAVVPDGRSMLYWKPQSDQQPEYGKKLHSYPALIQCNGLF
ncbi:MAG: hypothetical protein LAN71_00045 [Acidobacteriia bacterium]|nr:hypothetical protein [Terriglobia bacterium]